MFYSLSIFHPNLYMLDCICIYVVYVGIHLYYGVINIIHKMIVNDLNSL